MAFVRRRAAVSRVYRALFDGCALSISDSHGKRRALCTQRGDGGGRSRRPGRRARGRGRSVVRARLFGQDIRYSERSGPAATGADHLRERWRCCGRGGREGVRCSGQRRGAAAADDGARGRDGRPVG